MLSAMDENGFLNLKPETPVEAYALKKWHESFPMAQAPEFVIPLRILPIDPYVEADLFKVFKNAAINVLNGRA